MEHPDILRENISVPFDSRFIKIYDIEHSGGQHYFDASRREKDELVAPMTDDEFRSMLPDAVSCFVILNDKDEPRLLLTEEFRYTAGRFLLSVPAGLIDKEDRLTDDPVLSAAKREIHEETGLELDGNDRLFTVSPLVFSSPGMTDESNALACAVIVSDKADQLSQAGATGGEVFDGFLCLTVDDAKKILKEGTDRNGFFYSVYTWMALIYFVSDMWK